MNYLARPWRRAVVRVVVLALAVGVAPVNCLAGEPPGPQQPTTALAASIQKAVQHEAGNVAKVAPNAARQAGTSPASTGFFKSRTGIITLVLLAAGTGYALYSTSHDRIKTENVPYGGTWK